VRSAAGFTLFMIACFFSRRGRAMNLLAALAIAFLVLDPEQMFEASFQLSFGAVAFTTFAVLWLEPTPGPLALGIRRLADKDRDLHTEPRATQFRVELRLLAETVQLWARLPAGLCLGRVAVPARILLFFYDLTLTSAMIQLGLALPMATYFRRVSFSALSANAVIVASVGDRFQLASSPCLPAGSYRQIWQGVLAASQSAAAWHARWEPNSRIPGPPTWLVIAIMSVLAAVACWRASLARLDAPRAADFDCRSGCAAGVDDLACVFVVRTARRAGDEGYRRGTGRQHFSRTARGPDDVGGWRWHSGFRQTGQERPEHLVGMWFRRTRGAVPFEGST
jgi:competence protein ComEC